MKALKFHPLLRETLWGGRQIALFKGISCENPYIGESWELSGVAGKESVVCGGEFDGMPLSEVINRHGEALLGSKILARFGNEFPLLIKFIDTHEDLSVQVHPDDTMARKRHGTRGKNELWYVIQAKPGSRLYSGFKEEFSPEAYDQALATGSIMEHLRSHEAKPGDLFFLPAGRIHAIGAGLLIAEIQETSDITYRIYDYNRLDRSGKRRELHTELARQALTFHSETEYRTHYDPQQNHPVELIDCKHFTTTLHDLTASETRDLSSIESFVALVVLQGAGVLHDADGEAYSLRQGETLLIPASTHRITLTPQPHLKYLSCHIREE